MTPERWKQVDQLLQEAMERAPAERAAFLVDACGGDDDLRLEVKSLLDLGELAEGFFETPPADVAADWLAAKESRAGQMIGHYRIKRRLGAGGMGVVDLAHDTQLGRPAALKLSQTSLTQDAARVRRFRQEARAASALNHPNILTIYEVGQADSTAGDAHFIATEFIARLYIGLGDKEQAFVWINKAFDEQSDQLVFIGGIDPVAAVTPGCVHNQRGSIRTSLHIGIAQPLRET